MPSRDSRAYELLDQLAEDFAARYRRGERPGVEEYVEQHPDLAEDIRELLPAMVEIEQVKGEAQPAVATPALQQMGDYHLLREVGRGGMGVVYEAEQVSLNRRVALKILPQQLFPDARGRRRFEREARSAARLHHTNIVPIFGVGEHEGQPYYVMQFIQGLGLDEVIQELKQMHSHKAQNPRATAMSDQGGANHNVSAARMARSLLTGAFRPTQDPDSDRSSSAELTSDPVSGGEGVAQEKTHVGRGGVAAETDEARAELSGDKETAMGTLSDSFTLSSTDALSGQKGSDQKTYWHRVANIGVQVASALDYAHRQGVLHRDIKPGNLLLDTRGAVWVTDFGLAKADDQPNLTATGDILGTVRYMPPEAFEGRSEPRSDVYALGLTLYELLALRPAFDEKERNKLVKQVMTSEAVRLEKIHNAIPRDLVTIVHKAIEKEPGQRYASAAEFQADLQRFLNDEPIRARRVSLPERLARWGNRNKGLAAALSAVALLLLVVAVGSTLAAVHFQHTAQQMKSLASAREQERRNAVSAKEEADRRREEADRQRKRAEENFAEACKAVDENLKAGTEMVKVEGLKPAGQELLQSGVKFYERFLGKHKDDPTIRTRLAFAYLQVANAHSLLGRSKEAKTAITEAQRRFQTLAGLHPNDPEIQHGRAQCLFRMGKYEQAIQIWTKLVQPEDPRFQQDLASAYNTHAIALKKKGNLAESLRVHQQALTIRERLVRLDPDNTEYRRDLGGTLNNVGVLLSPKNRQQALEMYRRAEEHARAAHKMDPHVLLAGRFLALVLRNKSLTQRRLGRNKEALKSLQQATEVWQKVTAEYYALPVTHSYLYRFSMELAQFQTRLGDHAAAEQSLYLARSALARLPKNDPDDFLRLARVHALSASVLAENARELSPPEKREHQRQINLALAGLGKAIAAGYRKVDDLKEDSALAVLRERPEFKTLLAKLDRLVAEEVARGQNIETLKVSLNKWRKVIQSSTASPQEKLTAHQQVEDLLKKLERIAPSTPNLKADLAASQHAAGMLQTGLGNVDEAAKWLKQALATRQELVAKEPENLQHRADLADSHRALGDLHQKTNQLADAVKAWHKGLKLLQGVVAEADEDSPFARQLATVHRSLGDVYIRLGLWKEARKHHEQALGQHPTDRPSDWRRLALLQLLDGDRDAYQKLRTRMEMRFRRALQFPRSADHHEVTTTLALDSMSKAEARQLVNLTKKFAETKDWRWAWLYVAIADYRAGQPQEALSSLRKAGPFKNSSLRKSKYPPLMALIHHGLGEIDEAKQWLAEADAIHQDSVRRSFAKPELGFLTNIGPTYTHNRLQALLLRREAHQKIHNKPPPVDVLEHLYKAQLHDQMEQSQKAEAAFQAAVQAQPDDPRPWLLRGRVFHQLGRKKQAQEDFARAEKLKANDPQSWVDHWHYLLGQGETELAEKARTRALACFVEALAKEPDNETLAEGLAKFLLEGASSDWITLKPTDMKADGGVQLQLQSDGSILATGGQKVNDVYRLLAKSGLSKILGIRLETIPDSRFARGGSGRASNGNFHVGEFRVEVLPKGPGSAPTRIPIPRGVADYAHPGCSIRRAFDGKRETAWITTPRYLEPRTALFEFQHPVIAGEGANLRLVIDSGLGPKQHGMGRFRLLVTGDPITMRAERLRLELASGELGGFTALGATHELLGDRASAASAFARAVQRSPGRASVSRLAARAATMDGMLEALLKLRPNDPRLHLALCQHHLEQGEMSKADAAVARASSLMEQKSRNLVEIGWWVIGSYSRDLDQSCPPEVEKFADPSRPVPSLTPGKDLRWQPVVPNETGMVNLASRFGENRGSAYALAYLYAAREHSILLRVGGSNHVQVWLNGRPVHRTSRYFYKSWDLDLVPVTLRKGRNTLLVRARHWKGNKYVLWVGLPHHSVARAWQLAACGLWKEADAQFAFTTGASGEPQGKDRLFWQSLPGALVTRYAILSLAAGDVKQFRQIRDQLVGKWGKTTSLWVGNELARVLVCTPHNWRAPGGAKPPQPPPKSGVTSRRLLELSAPANQQGWREFNFAAALYRVGQHEKAIERIQSSRRLRDANFSIVPASWAVLAMAHYRKEKKEEARKWLKKLDAWYDAQLNKAKQGDRPVLVASPCSLALNLIFYREAKALIDGKDLKDDPRWKAYQAHNRNWLKNLDPATAAFDFAVELFPDSVRLRLARARCYAKAKRNKDAQAEFARVIALDPRNPWVWGQRARVYAELKQHEQAVADFLKGLELSPPPPRDSWARDSAGIYQGIVRHEEVFQRIVRDRPRDGVLWMYRLLYLGSQGNWREALEAGRKVMQLKPGSPWVSSSVAPLLLEMRDRAGYRRLCADLLERYAETNNPSFASQIAFTCLLMPEKSGDPRVVHRLTQKAASEKGPKWAQPWGELILALSEHRLGKDREAIARLEKIVAREPEEISAKSRSALAFTVLAMAYHHRKQKDKAREALKRAQDLVKHRRELWKQGMMFEDSWVDWLRCQHLLREAEGLIEGKKPMSS